MPFQFQKHYSIDEARSLLPKVRNWLEEIDEAQKCIDQLQKRQESSLSSGVDLGGDSTNKWVKSLADLHCALKEFEEREILIKDVQRGLIDFPALRDGREIFLCWEKDEEDIEHWHELDSGYANREPL